MADYIIIIKTKQIIEYYNVHIDKIYIFESTDKHNILYNKYIENSHNNLWFSIIRNRN